MKAAIWIKQSVLDVIFLNGKEWLPRETGGILMGYRASNGDFVINRVIGPGEKAVHGLSSFKPDHAYHVREIVRIYEESGCLETYLGDWHTHPNSYPYLSSQDKATIASIAKHAKARLANPLMLIAAPPALCFKTWIYDPCRFYRRQTYTEGKVIVFS